MYVIDFSKDWHSQLALDKEAQWIKEIENFIVKWQDKNIDSFTIYTSGSTGTPKEIVHSREAMIASASRTNTLFNLNSKSTFFLCLPVAKIGGQMMLLRAILAKAKIYFTKPTADPFSDIKIPPISFGAFTPMQVFEILKDEGSIAKFKKIENVIIGGGEVGKELQKRLAHFPNNIYETFGMTETVSHIALKKVSPNNEDFFTTLSPITINTDSENRLLIHQPNFPTLQTNDIVELISETQFRWIARYDDAINTGGIKVFANLIEEKLKDHLNTPFFITKTADEKFGEMVTIVFEKNNTPLKEIKFEAYLSKFERPKKILFVDKIKYTTTQKIIRDLHLYTFKQ